MKREMELISSRRGCLQRSAETPSYCRGRNAIMAATPNPTMNQSVAGS